MELPRLSRLPQRPEQEPGAERECWRPTWRCYCCEDTGWVRLSLVRMLIPDYDNHRDKPVICHNCLKHEEFSEAITSSVDWRFNEAICQKLDLIARNDWTETQKRWHELRKQRQFNLSTILNSLRSSERNAEENRVARLKHEEAIARANAVSQEEAALYANPVEVT